MGVFDEPLFPQTFQKSIYRRYNFDVRNRKGLYAHTVSHYCCSPHLDFIIIQYDVAGRAPRHWRGVYMYTYIVGTC